MSSFSSVLTFSLPFELLASDPASGSACTFSPNGSLCTGVEHVFTLVTPASKRHIRVQADEEADTGARSTSVPHGEEGLSQCQSQEDAM